jgi:hypothetical protein
MGSRRDNRPQWRVGILYLILPIVGRLSITFGSEAVWPNFLNKGINRSSLTSRDYLRIMYGTLRLTMVAELSRSFAVP